MPRPSIPSAGIVRRRLAAAVALVLLVSAFMPAAASAGVTIPIPPAATLIPPPIATMPSAGPAAPAAALIGDPVTPEAVCGSWALETTYGGSWSTDQSWWEFSCEHSVGPCVGVGVCNADLHSNDHSTWVDHFAFDGSTAVFYGESFDFYYYDDWSMESNGCFLWWDQATAQWYVAPDPGCGFAPQPPPPPNEAPVAVANVYCSGLRCGFDARGSWDPDGWIAGYAWSLGDGGTAAAFEGTHRYAAPGSYRIELTVTDDGDAAGVAAVDVVVMNRPPVAGIALDCTGLDCRYDASSSSDVDGTVVSYRWAFGDGQAATSKSDTYRYAAIGAYSLKLDVTDDVGGAGTASSSVTLIGLQAKAAKIRGAPVVNLTWTGAAGAMFNVYRDGVLLGGGRMNTFTDQLPRSTGGTVTYQVCEEGAPVCSGFVSVVA
jgi:chitodextrinase